MLFRALLSRINGGTDTASTKASSLHRRLSSNAYQRFSILPKLLCSLLRSSTGSVTHHVFPALEIIERFGLPEQSRAEILHILKLHLIGPRWALRDKVAKALASALPVAASLQELSDFGRHGFNGVHGILLLARWTLRSGQLRSDGTSCLLRSL